MVKKVQNLSALLILLITPGVASAFQIGGLSRAGDARYLTLGAFVGLIARQTDDGNTFFSFRLYPRIEIFVSRVQVGILAGVADVHWRGASTPLGFASGGTIKVNLLPQGEKFQVVVFGSGIYWRTGNFDCVEVGAGGLLSVRAGHSSFYAGVRYSELIVDGDARSKIPAGIILGIDYFVNPNFFLNAEMHNFDQDSLYLGAGYAF